MKLTKNFTRQEFDSKDGETMPFGVFQNIKKLAVELQALRDYLEKPITINSGYRSPSHNKKVGGVKTSKHVLGMAADIVIDGMTPYQVRQAIEFLILRGDMMQGGLGIYDTFVHYDIRGTKARWDFRNK